MSALDFADRSAAADALAGPVVCVPGAEDLAARYVARHALDAEDARRLLEALGLVAVAPVVRPARRRRKGAGAEAGAGHGAGAGTGHGAGDGAGAGADVVAA